MMARFACLLSSSTVMISVPALTYPCSCLTRDKVHATGHVKGVSPLSITASPGRSDAREPPTEGPILCQLFNSNLNH